MMYRLYVHTYGYHNKCMNILSSIQQSNYNMLYNVQKILYYRICNSTKVIEFMIYV